MSILKGTDHSKDNIKMDLKEEGRRVLDCFG
jgi:hypothetical protein